MRPGRRVAVRADAPGALERFQGWAGTIRRVEGRIATVELEHPDTTLHGADRATVTRLVSANWLDRLADVPESTRPADSPELAEFKKRVAVVARRYAREHGLCDVLDTALRELDIEPAEQQMVVITLRIPEDKFDFNQEEMEVEEVVAAQLEDLFRHNYSSTRTPWVTRVEFEDMTDLEKEDPQYV